VNTTRRELSKIPGMEEYKFYYVDMEGNIYSHKYKNLRKLRTHPVSNTIPYLTVKLSNGKGIIKSFYVGRLVASAFLPNHTNSWGIRYKDGDVTNNALSNLEWLGKKTATGLNTDHIQLSKELSDYIKLVHLSAVHKNIPVPPELEFFHKILNESLEEYINRYGLKKTMYMLENS